MKDGFLLKYLIVVVAFVLLFFENGSAFVGSLQANRFAVLIVKDLLGRAPCSMPSEVMPRYEITHASSTPTSTHQTWLSAVWGLRCGNTQEALVDLGGILSQEPDNLMIAITYMDGLIAQGRAGEARDVLKSYPHVQWQILAYQAVVAQKTGDTATASALMDGALSNLPTLSVQDLSYIFKNAAIIYEAAGRISDALWAQEQLATVLPDNNVVWGEIGALQFSLKMYPAAVASYTRAVSLAPSPYYASGLKRGQGLSLGAAARQAGTPLELEIPKVDPTVAWTLFVGAATVAADEGDMQEAAHLLDSAQEQSPLSTSIDRIVLYSTACSLYPRAGHVESGLRACEQMVDADPTNAYAWGMLGNVYLDYTSNYTSALAAYQKSLSLNPQEESWRLRLGDTYLALGDVQAALTEYKTVLQSNPASGEARLSVAALLATNGDVCGAVQQLRLALTSTEATVVERAQQRLGQLDSRHCVGGSLP